MKVIALNVADPCLKTWGITVDRWWAIMIAITGSRRKFISFADFVGQ
jgi:hypothetical protein